MKLSEQLIYILAVLQSSHKLHNSLKGPFLHRTGCKRLCSVQLFQYLIQRHGIFRASLRYHHTARMPPLFNRVAHGKSYLLGCSRLNGKNLLLLNIVFPDNLTDPVNTAVDIAAAGYGW